MYFEPDGGWLLHTNIARKTHKLFVPYDLAEEIWREWTGGGAIERKALQQWMKTRSLLLAALASNPPGDKDNPGFHQDQRFIWIPVLAGSELDLMAQESIRVLEIPMDLLDDSDLPPPPGTIH